MGEVVEAPTLNTEEFVVPPSDDKGNNVVCNVRVQPMYMRQMQILTTDGNRFGFRTVSDLVRHAIDRELRWLTKLGKVKSLMSQLNIMNRGLRDEIINAEFVKVFEKLDKIIANDMQQGTMNHAIKVILQTKHDLDEMQDGHYKDQYLKVWRDKYSRYLDNATKASFSKFSEE